MITSIIEKITGKTLDSRISVFYILQRGRIYLCSLFRGFWFRLFFAKSGKSLCIGKGVTILMPKNLSVGSRVRIDNYVVIDALSLNGIFFGDNVKIGEYSKIIGSGSISSLGKGLRIGNNTFFSEYTFFGAAGGITIGSDVIAGQNVRFHSENHNYKQMDILIREQGVNHQGIKIGNNCWIGSGAVFLDGAEIGCGCVVAANSVVTKSFGDNVIIGGIPAKVIKYRE
ncbi:MAG: acyltransferase [Lactobacillus johnsonii]|nr:acyltransferase [Lactobacillus johnsonii]